MNTNNGRKWKRQHRNNTAECDSGTKCNHQTGCDNGTNDKLKCAIDSSTIGNADKQAGSELEKGVVAQLSCTGKNTEENNQGKS